MPFIETSAVVAERVRGLEERLNALEQRLSNQLEKVDAKTDQLLEDMTRAKTGLRIAQWIGAAVFALSGYVAGQLHAWTAK